MKQLVVIISLSLIISCSPGGVDRKKAELEDYRKKVEEYNEKIVVLEAELEDESSSLRDHSCAR